MTNIYDVTVFSKMRFLDNYAIFLTSFLPVIPLQRNDNSLIQLSQIISRGAKLDIYELIKRRARDYDVMVVF